MSRRTLATHLRERGHIQKSVQSPASSGGFARSYETLITIWMNPMPISHGMYIRGVQADIGHVTHEIEIRAIVLKDLLGREFSEAFSEAFNVGVDIRGGKSEYFILWDQGNDRGVRFRIRRMMEVGEKKEKVSLLCEEMQEHGTGWS